MLTWALNAILLTQIVARWGPGRKHRRILGAIGMIGSLAILVLSLLGKADWGASKLADLVMVLLLLTIGWDNLSESRQITREL